MLEKLPAQLPGSGFRVAQRQNVLLKDACPWEDNAVANSCAPSHLRFSVQQLLTLVPTGKQLSTSRLPDHKEPRTSLF